MRRFGASPYPTAVDLSSPFLLRILNGSSCPAADLRAVGFERRLGWWEANIRNRFLPLPVASSRQFVEERFCGFQVGRGEAFGKAIVDGLKQRKRLNGTALIA